MPLLADYAITPDVFDSTSYSSDEVCRHCLRAIGEVMRSEGLVRDLRDGEWLSLFTAAARPWHRRGRELLRKLATQGRLISVPPELPRGPVNDLDWCDEALATHARRKLTGGVIVTQPVKDAHRSNASVASIDRLHGAAWWATRSPSVRLTRCMRAYRRHLDLILRHAKSLCFVDPHLDPTKTRYERFSDLLVAAGTRVPAPSVEIHRRLGGPGPPHRIITQLELDFRQKLAAPLQAAGLRADVFVWDQFHDRYLISNLVGISLPNGFDTSRNTADMTTWTRLGSRERDDVQREFDPASNRHRLHGKFAIP